MKEQFEKESWEIFERSDIFWEEKEMLWISSLGENERLMLRFPVTLNSGYLEFSATTGATDMESQCNTI
jgi:hypothetical protein